MQNELNCPSLVGEHLGNEAGGRQTNAKKKRNINANLNNNEINSINWSGGQNQL
jgi:hypothetical protein